MASTIGDDPAGQCLTMSTGGQGADTIVKAMAEGTDEVKDLLRHEAEFIIECRYCRNLYRSIPNFLSHKRQYCRTICRNALASDIIAKQVEEFGERILNDKVSPPQSTRKNAGQSRRNIAAMFQKKVQSTIVVPDEFNKVELHSLPNISRAVPQTSFFDGQQWIVKQNKNMAVKEHLDTDDRSILIMPQDTNVSQRAGDMTLRRRKLVDVQEKEMTGRELIVLDYIPASVRHHINPASCTCNYPSCTGLKAFESLLSLAYHLTLKHNRPLTEKETIQMRRGREGMFLCFLCSTTHGSSDKLVTHLKKEHAEVLAAHEEFRTKQRNELPGRSRRRLEPSQRSMSPQFNNDAPSAEEDNEEEGANVEEVPETREPTPPPAKPKTRASSAKKPIAKKILPKRMQRRRRRAETVETPTSQSSQPIPRLIDADPEISMINSQKSVTPTGTLDEVARRLSTTNSPPSVTTSESPEPAPAVLLTCKEEPVSGITEGTGEAPPEPPASTHPQHETSSRLTTRSPSVDGDPIIRRSQRAHRRRPLHFDEYATTEREFRAHSAGRVKRARLTSPLPPSTTPAPKVRISFRHEARDADEDEEEDIKPIIKRPLPTTESVTVGKGPVLPRPTGVTSAIVKTRQALSATIRKVRTTTAPTTPSNGKYGGAGVDDLEAWVMPTEDSNSGTESLPFTPRAQEAIEVTKGSSRRKQRLDISDDGNNDLTVLSSPEEDDDQPARPEDLAALPIILTTADETIFYQALKPRFKEGTDGNHQCAECGEVLLSLCEGRKHMIGHVRAVRFRCALCDSGAFYVEAMREHLLNRHCPGLHMASQFCTPGIPCMTTKNADGLTKIVCPENPGKFMFTSGKIVTQDNPKPHRPDPKAEENILGPCQPPRLSPSKSLAILNHTRSPMKNFSQMHAHLQPSTMSPAVDHPSTSTSRPTPATQSTRAVTPLKIIARKPTLDQGGSNTPTFTLLKRPPTNPAVSTSSFQN